MTRSCFLERRQFLRGPFLHLHLSFAFHETPSNHHESIGGRDTMVLRAVPSQQTSSCSGGRISFIAECTVVLAGVFFCYGLRPPVTLVLLFLALAAVELLFLQTRVLFIGCDVELEDPREDNADFRNRNEADEADGDLDLQPPPVGATSKKRPQEWRTTNAPSAKGRVDVEEASVRQRCKAATFSSSAAAAGEDDFRLPGSARQGQQAPSGMKLELHLELEGRRTHTASTLVSLFWLLFPLATRAEKIIVSALH